MARKKKPQIEKTPNIPRGAEHRSDLVESPHDLVKSKYLRLDQAGREIPSTEPIVMSVNRKLIGDPDLIRLQIQRLRAMSPEGVEFETFEEADDFDLEDDYGDFTSQWEIRADHDESVDAYVRYRQTGEIPEWVATKLAKNAPAGPKPPSQDFSSLPPAPPPPGGDQPPK